VGAFDDLIPRRPAAGPVAGAFDDLVPDGSPVRPGGGSPAAAPVGAFDDLVPARPAPEAPPAGPMPGAQARLAADPLPSPALPLFAGQPPAQAALPVQSPLARLLDPRERAAMPGGAPAARASGERVAPAAAQAAVSPAECAGLLESVRNGLELTPQQDAALRLRLPPEGVRALDEALQAARLRGALADDSPLIPGGPAAETFMAGAVRGATLNALPAPGIAGVPAVAEAMQARDQARRGEHPVADIGGEIAGSLVPYVAGAQALRAAQGAAGAGGGPVARGIQRLLGRPATAADTAALVREGATLSAPIEFARRPEGAEQMTAGEELATRGGQAVLGAGLGAAGDALLVGVLGPALRRGGLAVADLATALRDRRTAAALEAEAKQAGFESADAYVQAGVEVVTRPDGTQVVVPRADVLRRLPGAPDSAGAGAPPPPGAPPVRGEGAAPTGAPDAPTPEAPPTLQAQWEAFAQGRKPAVLLTPGEALPDVLPAGARVADVPGRGTLIYRDPATLEAARAGRMGEALGYGIDEKPTGTDTVVTARDAQGRVVQDVVTDGRPQVVEAAAQAAGPQGTVQERTAQAALEERAALRRAAELDRLAEQAQDAQVKALLRQEAQRTRDRAAGIKPKLTPAERNRARLAPDFERDDLLTLIRKMGGLNVDSGDWRGYLNPVADRVPGLPNPEQSGGRGMALDDLAQVLWEQGWIPEHNLQLVEELLDRVRTGEKLYHPHSDTAAKARLDAQRERDAGAAWQASTDEDWTFDLPGAPADRSATDFVFENETGTVVPARAVTLEDLERIDAERRAADEWFRREGGEDPGPDEFAGGLAGDGTLGVPDRPPGALQGRAGDEPGSADVAAGADRPRAAGAAGQLDLAGLPARNETAQALADRGRVVDARLSGGGQEVPIDAGPGGLFSARARNLDLLDAPGTQGAGAFDDLIPAPAAAPAQVKTLSPQPENVIEFPRLFGDSVVTDTGTPMREGGRPLVVYHGSPERDFARFDPERINKSDPDGPVNGFFFSTDFAEAERAGRFPWMRPNAPDAQTRAFYLSIRTPASMEEVTRAAKDLRGGWVDRYPKARSLQDAVRFELERRGFDGVVREYPDERVFVAFRPEQIIFTANHSGDASGLRIKETAQRAAVRSDVAPEPAPPADPLTPQQRASYERLREAADFEPETLTPEQWQILENLERRVRGVSPSPAPRVRRRTMTAAERERLRRDFEEGESGSAADLEAESGARPPDVSGGPVAATTQPRAPRVVYEAVDRLPTATRTVRTAEDVAHLAATLRRDAQESVLAVVTDEAGQVLRVARVARGGLGSAAIDPRVAAGAATSTPGGKQVWFVHNHPAGEAAQSPADAELTAYLTDLLRGSGVDVRGMVTVAPGRSAAVDVPGQGQRTLVTPAGRRTDAVPVQERRLRGAPREAPVAREDLPQALPQEEGVMLLSGDGRPARWVPMSADEMRLLRRGEGGPSQRLLAAIDESNAERLAARVTHAELGEAAAGNVRAFARQVGLADEGVFDAAGRTLGEGAGQATFYANPFLAGLAPVAREVGRHPRRAAASAFAGAVGGATLSEGEPGSAQWWLDVATGAAVGTGSLASLRALGVTGKGAILDGFRARAGQWMNEWLFGNLEVRQLKRDAQLMRQVLDRQTAQVGQVLKERFTPSQRAKMADLIESRGIVADFNAVHAQAAALEEYLTQAAEQMKALGMLPADLEAGGYLHRYYAKHLGLDQAFREAKAQSLSGSYSIARGTESAFGREYLSPGARAVVDELAQVQRELEAFEADDLLAADPRAQALRERRRDLRKTAFVEFIGEQDGKPHSFFFVRPEVSRVAGDDGRALLARLNQPRPGEVVARGGLPDVEGIGELSPTDRVWTATGARKAGQGESEVLLHRDWTKAERQAWGEIDDAGYRYVRGMAEVSHDLATATLFKTVANRQDWARSTDPGLWLDPPPGKRRFKGQPWVKVPDARVGKRSPLKRYGALSGLYVRPDVWQALKHYGQPVFEMPPGKFTVPAGAALGAAYGAAAGPLGAFGGAVAGAGIGALASRELYRHWLAHWKAWKTVYNPVTHLNNTYSNTEMLLMAGYSPRDLGAGIKHLWDGEQSEVWREARDAGLFGTDWVSSILSGEGGLERGLLDLAEELRTQAEIPDAVLVTDRLMRAKEWFVRSQAAVREADGPWKTGIELARAAGVPALKGLKTTAAPVRVLGRAAQNLYRFEDNVFKMAVFAAARQRGMTPRQAVDEANTFFFDYSDVPDAVRLVRDLPVGSPFVTYTYKVIPAIARHIVQRPESVLALVAGYEAMHYAGMLADGAQPGEYWATAEADDELAPPWDRGRSMWGARNTVRLPFVEGYRMALGRAHAAGNPFASEAGGRTILGTPQVLQGAWGPALYGSSPLAAVLDVLTNQDWRGQTIYDAGAPDAEKAKSMAAYLYQAWTPSNVLTPGSYQQGKALEGLANDVRTAQEEGRAPPVLAPIVDLANAAAADLGVQGFTGLDRGGNPIQTRDALLASFGVKVRPIRAEDSLDIQLGQIKRELGEAKRWIRKQGDLAGEGRISEDQYDANIAQYERQVEKLTRQQDRLLDAMDRLRASGVTVQVEEPPPRRHAVGE
jgi:DNA repair protein RadC